jgi:uncharacterized protein YndB with AHSA1/START domain
MTDASAPVMAEYDVTTTRVFNAPRELVWAAWTEPEQLTRWWGPRGLTTPLESITVDLRPGGVFALTMVGPDGSLNRSDGHFDEVVEYERLAFSGEVPNSPMLERASTVVTFTDLGDGRTEVVAVNRLIAVAQMPALAQAGWASQFDRLEELLLP